MTLVSNPDKILGHTEQLPCGGSGQGDGGAGFEGLHDEGAFDGRDVVESAEHVEDEVAVIGHVGSHDFQHIVESARYVVALGDLFDRAYAVDESLGFFAT